MVRMTKESGGAAKAQERMFLKRGDESGRGVFKDKQKRYGSPARQKHSSSHYGFLKFKNQESTRFQRVGPKTPGGGGGGGAMHQFPKELGQGSCSGYGITFRSPRDPRHKFWEITNDASLRLSSKRSIDNVLSTPSHACSMNNGEKPYSRAQCHDNKKKNYERESSSLKRRIDDVLSTPSHACSINTRQKLNSSEQCHDNNKKNYEREDSLGWKPLNKGNNTFERERKRPRLNWGEGLAKFEKNKIEGDGVSVATAATPASGVGDTLCVKMETTNNDVCELGGSPGPVSPKNHQLKSPLSSQRKAAISLNRLRSSIAKLLHYDKSGSVDSNPEGFTAMTKLQIWKNVIAQVLEQTKIEICSLENELEPLQFESGDGMPCYNTKSCDKEIGDYHKVTHRPELSQIGPSNDDNNIEKMMPLSANLHGMHDTTKENDISSPGTTTPKFVEAQPLIKMVSSLGGGSSFSSLMEIEDGMKAHTSIGFYSSIHDYTLPNTIISSNRETAQSACVVFKKFLHNKTDKIISNVGVSNSSLSHVDAFIKDKLAKKNRFARFKEKALTIKYKALDHLWKRDMCLRYPRKRERFSRRNLQPLEKILRIASFIDHKTTADCVEFYYKDHKPNCLEKDKKKKNKKKGCSSQKSKTSKTIVKALGKKGNRKANVD
ncbi:hypothetical protein JHK85_048453 [Glycine max]|nr:hypothetical protein JHK85_048453 [Glycine max]